MRIPDNLFDPNCSFFQLPIVRWTFYVVAFFAIWSTLKIIASTDLAYDPTANGFSEFLKIFRFPIGVMALLIPLMAIYATNHRSIQQKKQIEVAVDQNNFSNYYKHLEEFCKYYSEFWMDFQMLVMRPAITPKDYHRLFYKNARTGNYQVDLDFYEKQREILLSIIQDLKAIDHLDDPVARCHSFAGARMNIQNFCNSMYLRYYGQPVKKTERLPSSSSSAQPALSIMYTIAALQEGIHFFMYLAKFSPEPIFSREFAVITFIDVSETFKKARLENDELKGYFGFSDAFKRWDKVYVHN